MKSVRTCEKVSSDEASSRGTPSFLQRSKEGGEEDVMHSTVNSDDSLLTDSSVMATAPIAVEGEEWERRGKGEEQLCTKEL